MEEAVRTMRSDLLRAAMPILAIPSSLNVKAEQPDSCSDSMVCPKNILLLCHLLTSHYIVSIWCPGSDMVQKGSQYFGQKLFFTRTLVLQRIDTVH